MKLSELPGMDRVRSIQLNERGHVTGIEFYPPVEPSLADLVKTDPSIFPGIQGVRFNELPYRVASAHSNPIGSLT